MTSRAKVMIAVGVVGAVAAVWWLRRRPTIPDGTVEVIEGTRYQEADGLCFDLHDGGALVDMGACRDEWRALAGGLPGERLLAQVKTWWDDALGAFGEG